MMVRTGAMGSALANHPEKDIERETERETERHRDIERETLREKGKERENKRERDASVMHLYEIVCIRIIACVMLPYISISIRRYPSTCLRQRYSFVLVFLFDTHVARNTENNNRFDRQN